MREILFRGKRIDNELWKEGCYIRLDDSEKHDSEKDLHIIVDEHGEYHRVDPETLGEFTGLTDKNGVKVFEGDILVSDEYPYTSDGKQNYFAEVVWFDNVPAFGLYTFKAPKSAVRGIAVGSNYIEFFNSSKWEIIGNIHDNPEILQEESE